MLYGGRVVRELQGDELTERNILAASLDLPESENCSGGACALNGLQFWLTRNSGAISIAVVLFVAMFVIYIVKNGVGLRVGPW